MKYVYVICALVCLAIGAAIGHKFFPRTELREVPKTVTKTQVVTKEITRFPDGKIVERLVTQTIDKTKTSPQPAIPQYRAGILIPLAKDLPTVSVGRRLFGDVWAESQFDLRHKEVTLGVSYEW